MKTRKEQMENSVLDNYNNFLGDDSDYQDWYVVLGQHRDSNALERSNFKVGLAMLGGESNNVRVERYDHWAFGWAEMIYVRPKSEAYDKAVDIVKRLKQYPVSDEQVYSELEK